MIIEFYKYQGTGNDFIIIDNRNRFLDGNNRTLINLLCKRKVSIGADGLILLQNHNKFDFEMIYFNADGKESTMCGNGSRCIVDFAKYLGMLQTDQVMFVASDGVHKAVINEDVISIKMNDVEEVLDLDNGFFLDTGSPHFVSIVKRLSSVNVSLEGGNIRRSNLFNESGVNVNFVECNKLINVRTYERGVEDETLSCGTGVVATVIALYHKGMINDTKVVVNTKGGILTVNFMHSNNIYHDIWLSGSAQFVYKGNIAC